MGWWLFVFIVLAVVSGIYNIVQGYKIDHRDDEIKKRDLQLEGEAWLKKQNAEKKYKIVVTTDIMGFLTPIEIGSSVFEPSYKVEYDFWSGMYVINYITSYRLAQDAKNQVTKERKFSYTNSNKEKLDIPIERILHIRCVAV